jgi:hypothetical protein
MERAVTVDSSCAELLTGPAIAAGKGRRALDLRSAVHPTPDESDIRALEARMLQMARRTATGYQRGL